VGVGHMLGPPVVCSFGLLRYITFGGVAQWLGRRSFAGGLSLIYV